MATKTRTRPSTRKIHQPRINNLPAHLEETLSMVAENPNGMTKEEAINALKSTVETFKGMSMDMAAKNPNTNLTSELNNIDFKKMIGGPLQAAVDAQVASSIATINFINAVGFTEDPTSKKKELVMVDFSHNRKDIGSDGKDVNKQVSIRVPLLAMLPIPSLRIEHVIIDFNVKLNSVETSSVSDKLGVNISAQGGWGPVSFKVSASYQRQTATGVEVKKEYALNVNVKAIQDEIPAGLEKILGMLAA